MQKQKTIAKWLAIILLLTVLVACYLALSAIFNDKSTVTPPDVAGADETGGTGENSDSPHNPPSNVDEQPKPVYSVLPRSAETVGGLTVRHVGGEDNDVVLDTIYYFGRRLVFFYTASNQYDVKEAGIHIAVFVGDTLSVTVKVGDAVEEFVAASVVENGLLIVTKTAGSTKLRLLDDDLRLTAQSTCASYSSYKLTVTSSATRLYVADTRYVYALSLSHSLEVTRSNFVYPLDYASIEQVVGFGAEDAIFVQSEQGVGVLTFSTIAGFSYKTELTNCRFMQITPTVIAAKQAVVVTAKSDDGIRLAIVDDTLSRTASYLIPAAKNAVTLRQDSGNLTVIAGEKAYSFCSHLELQSEIDITVSPDILSAFSALGTSATDSILYTSIDGENDKFILSNGTSHFLVKIDESGAVTPIFSAVCNRLITAYEPYVQGKARLSVLLSGTNANVFGYMCFGKNDVFYVTLP